MKGYADLANFPEDKRIELIAQCVVENKNTVAVVLDDKETTISRYERKLLAARPGLIEIERCPGLVKKTVTLRIKPKTQNVANN